MYEEEIFHYGENDRGIGVLTLPLENHNVEGAAAPIVVFLNAGLLHRVEPYRLNVLVSRALVELGYICLRVDLSGKGDTPSRENLVNRESVVLDWRLIKQSLQKNFGDRNIVVMGLCSGADNAIKLTREDESICGLILLDAVSPRDFGYLFRYFFHKLSDFKTWLKLPYSLKNRAKEMVCNSVSPSPLAGSLRDLPTGDDITRCFESIVKRRGQVLAVFTSHSLGQYNQEGQFAKVLDIVGLTERCKEIFWPTVMHLYPVESHRERLVNEIVSWAKVHYEELSGRE